MRRGVWMFAWPVVALVLCMSLAFDGAVAEGKEKKPKAEKKPKKESKAVTATGTLAVTKDDEGKVTGVTLSTQAGESYTVDVGKAGQKFAKMDGKTVEVMGTLCEKDGQTFLRIGKCKEVKGEGAKEEKKEEEKGDKKEEKKPAKEE